MSRLSDVSQFIAASRNASSADDLRALMEPMTRYMGFHNYALFQHRRRFRWSEPKQLALSDYPLSWIEHYFEKEMSADDPIHLASCRTGVGYSFEEVYRLIPVTARQQKVMEASRKAGITDGFSVPSHVPGEASGSCTFIVRDGAALPVRNLLMAQLVGSFAYEAARQLLLRGEPVMRCAKLTTRQLECVLLVGKGKTDREIARILGIKEDTVKEHIEEARRRVGGARRSALPIRAVYRGDLSFSDILD